MSREPDEFDRIVEGLEFDLDDLGDWDARAEAAAAKQHDDDVIDAGSALESDDGNDNDEPEPEFAEVIYREAPPVSSTSDPKRLRGWLSLLVLPITVLLSSLLSIRISAFFWMVLVLGTVGMVAYLLLTLPDQGPASPGWPEDGSEL